MKGEVLDQGLIANLEVKIGDLGAMGDELRNKRQAEHFTAPECLRTRLCTQASDVYSFGKVLCHLFSEGLEEPQSPANVTQNPHNSEIWNQKWKDLIISCTQVDPELRPNFSNILDTITNLVHSKEL